MADCKRLAPSNSAILTSSSTPPKTYAQHEHAIQSPDGRNAFEGVYKKNVKADVDVREVYFLIMHFLSEGPCRRAFAQLRSELLEHRLLPRRYHAWYSRDGACSGDNDDDGASLTLSYPELADRFSFIEKDHLVKLLQQLLVRCSAVSSIGFNAQNPTAADASTLLGLGSVSLLNFEQSEIKERVPQWKSHVHWLHGQADQVHALAFREFGGGFARHHRAPSIRAASYAIAKPPVLVDRIQIIKTFRGHRNAVYCAIFDRSGEYIITGSDDRLVKIWSTATGFCLCSCRGHDGDITDLAVNASNTLVASSSNDFFIRVWRLPDGIPISVLCGHTSAVTAIVFSPRPGCEHHLLSSSDDGTCRIWDARDSLVNARVYTPKQETAQLGTKAPASVQPNVQSGNQILCCAFNASGTIFVTGSADKLARVWDACKWTDEHNGGPNYELDALKGHEDDVNYVQFSGCAALARPFAVEVTKDERISKFRNSWFAYESIVTCSRDGSAIIWIPRPRKYHGKSGRWMKSYHLRVPPPPIPPQPPRGGGPRQRLLPTPRGVNMIVWSLDNSFVLAAIMDCRICVWNAVDGSLVHSLTGHSKSTFVLDVHPCDPRIAMSAGYDGRVIIWDIWEGHPIRVYETGDFNLVDGKFSPDGTSIVISDEVGQIYLLGTGQGESQKDAKYDQFFLGDYHPLSRDVHGNVLDQETQLPPYHRNLQDLLCDANMIPYAEPYQSLYQQRRLGALGSSWRPPALQLAVGGMYDAVHFAIGDLHGREGILAVPGDLGALSVSQQGATRWVEQPLETDDGMDWDLESVDDSGSDYTASIGDATDEDERGVSQNYSEDFIESLEEESSSGDEHSQSVYLRRSERNKKKSERTVITSSGRLVKRKFADDGYGTPLRRSKRHKKPKLSRQGSSSQGISDSEFSRRPKRMAARNARLIFSQVSDMEDEDAFSEWEKQRSTTDEHISCGEEQQKSTGNSREMDPNEKVDIRGLAMDEVPSDIGECSRHKNSSLVVKLRTCTQRTVEKEDIHSMDDHTPLRSTSKRESSRSQPMEDINAMKQNSVKNQCSALSDLDRSDSPCIGADQKHKTLQYLGETVNLKRRLVAVENDDDTLQDTRELSAEKQKWELQNANIVKCPPDPSPGKLDGVEGLVDTAELVSCALESTQGLSVPCFKLETEESFKNAKVVKHPQVEDLLVGQCKIFSDADPPAREIDSFQGSVAQLEAFLPELCKNNFQSISKVVQADETNTAHGASYSCVLKSHGMKNCESETLGHKDVVQNMNEMDEVHYPEVEPPEIVHGLTCGMVEFEESRHTCNQTEQELISLGGNKHCERKMCSFVFDSHVANTVNQFRGERSENNTVMRMFSSIVGMATPSYPSRHCDRSKQVNYQPRNLAGRKCSAELSGGSDNPVCEKVTVLIGQIRKRDTTGQDLRLENDGTCCFVGLPEKATPDQYDRETDGAATLFEQHLVETGNNKHDGAANRDIEDTASGKGEIPLDTESSIDEHKVVNVQDNAFKEKNCTEKQALNAVIDSFEETMKIKTHNAAYRGHQEAGSRGRRTSWEQKSTRKHHSQGRSSGVNDYTAVRQDERCGSAEMLEQRNLGYETSTTTTYIQKCNEESNTKSKKMRRQYNIPTTMQLRQGRSEHKSSEPMLSGQEYKKVDTELIHEIKGGYNEGNRGCDLCTKNTMFPVRPRRNNSVRKEHLSDNEDRVQALAGWKGKGGRSKKRLSWLMLTEVEEGIRYIPQVGDEVAYVMQGHEEFLNSMQLDDKGPWKTIRVHLKAVEICRVVWLEYCCLPGYVNTCCRLTLKFIDDDSKAYGRSFKLLLPELTNFPDFIIEKVRYDAAMKRRWTKRDKCKVWWREGDGKGGKWWEGRVVAVEAKSKEFPESPWDRCTVKYRGDSSGLHKHSPWELFDLNKTKVEFPHIDDHCKAQFLSIIEEVEERSKNSEDEYGLRKLRRLVNRLEFLNKVPVPLSLETIKARLLNDYYRCLEALRYDARLLVSNAEYYSGQESDLAAKMRRLVDHLLENKLPGSLHSLK